jgi:predicted dehydrogenase
MLNAAIVGLGWWGSTIVRMLKESDKIRITTATDIDPGAAVKAASFGLAFQPGFQDILADKTIDAVILCTPHSQHMTQIAAAAAAKKHVFCEKPLSLTRADAIRAVAACNEHKIVLGVGHERRFEPPLIEVRRLVEAGTLGTLLQFEANFSQDKFLQLDPANWRLSAQDAPAGPMTATGIHLLDFAVSLLGKPKNALCRVTQLGSALANGDTLAALISFESGANALISAILATPFDARIAIYGSKGWVEVRDKAHVEAPEGWVLTKSIRGEGKTVTDFPTALAVRANLDAFADAAAGRAAYPIQQAQMIATIATLEACFKSSRSGAIEVIET